MPCYTARSGRNRFAEKIEPEGSPASPGPGLSLDRAALPSRAGAAARGLGWQARLLTLRRLATMAPQLNMPLIDLSTDRLRFYRQIGADEVTLPGEWSPRPRAHPLCPPSD